jgi:hypothetical protein
MPGLAEHYLAAAEKRFRYLKELGEKAFAQVSDEAHFHAVLDRESNSLAVLIQHLRGNMLSRWTDFLTTDGEKPSRKRDTEFDREKKQSSNELLDAWNEGWDCLFKTLATLQPSDLQRNIAIRGEDHSVLEAIQRQLTHCAYHVGQIVFLAKHLEAESWESLSIPRGQSEKFFRLK